MQTILAILKRAGGWHPGLHLKIDNPPYMELVIEAMDESGPMDCQPSPFVTTANRTATSCAIRRLLRAWHGGRPAP